MNGLTIEQALPVPQKHTRSTARWRTAVLADGGVNRLTMKQALPVTRKHTSPHRKVVLADGGVNRLTIEQALLVPQKLTSPRRQAADGGSSKTIGSG